MEGKYDKLLFITTTKMYDKGKGKALERTLNLPENSIERIIIPDSGLNEILEKLESIEFPKESSFIVNLTCGTKIMSIGVYQFFSSYISSFYYLPIGKNSIENLRTGEEVPLKYRLNVKEYLSLYGLFAEEDNSFLYSAEHTFSLFERFKNVNFHRTKLVEISNARSLPRHRDRKYYSGIWFEEYVYLRIKKELNLENDKILKNVKIYRNLSKTPDNEIDLIFIKENKLFIVECKVSMIGNPKSGEYKKLLEQYMYKLAAISKDFGLIVNSYIFTLHRFDRISPEAMNNLEKRMKILGINGILESMAFKQNKLEI